MLSAAVSEDITNRKRAEVIRKKNRRDDVPATACEKEAAGDTRMKLGLIPD